MKMTSIIYVLLLCGLLYACNDDNQKNSLKNEPAMPAPVTAVADYKNLDFDVKKDIVCGMPVSAGISDTAHYKDKLYGFCSKGCKDDFEKDPLVYVKTIK